MVRLVHDSDPPERARADDEAMAWVVRLTSGESTPEEHEQFRQWRDASPLHAEALARARTLWSRLGAALPEIERERADGTRRARWTLPRRLLPLAASLLLAVGLGYQYVHVWQFDQVTATGERRTLTLADGSRVMLGAGSAINQHFDAATRRIVLARGQAFFQVAHDAARPFVVEAGGAHFRDVGTAFDVAVTRGAARIVVREGVVEASGGDGGGRVRLTANRAVEVAATGIGTVRTVDAARETAWTRGRFLIADQPLGAIIDTIAPYSSRRIVILDGKLAARRMSAAIAVDGIDEWLTALDRSGTAHVIRLPGLVIIR